MCVWFMTELLRYVLRCAIDDSFNFQLGLIKHIAIVIVIAWHWLLEQRLRIIIFSSISTHQEYPVICKHTLKILWYVHTRTVRPTANSEP